MKKKLDAVVELAPSVEAPPKTKRDLLEELRLRITPLHMLGRPLPFYLTEALWRAQRYIERELPWRRQRRNGRCRTVRWVSPAAVEEAEAREPEFYRPGQRQIARNERRLPLVVVRLPNGRKRLV